MEVIDKMSYQERCEGLNKNVVLVARHFQYRVKDCLKDHCYELTFRKNSVLHNTCGIPG